MAQYKKGFSVLEFLFAISIIILIWIAVGKFSSDVFVYNRIISNSLSAQQDARQVLRIFTGEIRTAQNSDNGSFVIAETADNSFTFYSDTDKDGKVEKVHYYLSGTTFKKDIIKPTGSPAVYTSTPEVKTLITNIANGATPVFSYYDSSYSGTSAPLAQPVVPNSVRLVKINLILEQDPNQAPTPLVSTTQVQIRNLKDNL